MDQIFFYTRQSMDIIIKNRKLAYPSVLILFLVSYYSLILNPESLLNISLTKKYLPKRTQKHPNTFRFLEATEKSKNNSNITENYNATIKKFFNNLNKNITELSLYYEFYKNISLNNYNGYWSNLYEVNNNFKEKNKGYAEIGFFNTEKKNTHNYFFNLNQKLNNSNISAFVLLRDGIYIDNYIITNFTFSLNNIPLIDNLKKDNFSIFIPNTSVSYSYGQYLLNSESKKLHPNASINLTFFKKYQKLENKIKREITSTDYSYIQVHILVNNTNITTKNKTKKFEVFVNADVYGLLPYPSDILNYSIILTALAIVEIYYTTKLLLLMIDNTQTALNLDLYTIFMHIIWTTLICAFNFYFSLSNESLTYEFGMPSMTYFALFSIFLLKILTMAWKARNTELMFRDITLFKKKLLKFYFGFYFLLFVTLLSFRIWYTFLLCTLFLFANTWIFQIIYSFRNGTKPPLPYTYIFVVSLFKMLIPIYLKANPFNIFGIRPNYYKVLICDIIVLIEAIFVSLQKLLGPKFFIPKNMRKPTFDYYKTTEEIENELGNECVICLENLSNTVSFEENETQKNYANSCEKLAAMIQKWNKTKNTKPYMVTPCKHIFHTRCLESWLEVKNECPYCRQKIPPLED